MMICFGAARSAPWRKAWPAIVLGLAAAIVPCWRLGAIEPVIEDLSLAATYGSGVHSYFAGDYDRSYQDLSQVIEAGTGDPRAYYFRGLAALKLGRLDEAEADFSAGSSRESEGGAWPVARSLERVQGCDRLQLERHRRRARVASLQDNRRRRELRYLEIERAEPEVLRERRPVGEQPADEGNPFAERVPAAEPVPAEPAKPAVEPATEPAEAATEPAAESPAPPAEKPAEDPFGDLK